MRGRQLEPKPELSERETGKSAGHPKTTGGGRRQESRETLRGSIPVESESVAHPSAATPLGKGGDMRRRRQLEPKLKPSERETGEDADRPPTIITQPGAPTPAAER